MYTSKSKEVFAALVLALLATSSWAAPDAGDRVLTLSGSGSSDNSFDSTSFSVNGELGWFMNSATELGVRQSVNGTLLDDVDDIWNGATRLYADWHFGGRNPFQPYIGVSIGGFYGENINDTFSAGPELGMKYYVKDKTFIEFTAEYQFLFEDTDEIDSNFDDGAFLYSLGIGYNF